MNTPQSGMSDGTVSPTSGRLERLGLAGRQWGVLLGMEERAHLLGGSLAVESALGQGTTVRAERSLESDTRDTDGDGEKEP